VLLSELIQADVIKIGLEATNKWEAIEELIDLLITAHELRLTDRAEVAEAVFTRERSLSTGLEHGLAVPHGSVDCVNDIIAGLGVSRRGIPFESLDGRPAHIVALLVIPKGSFQRHVRTLAGIARLAMNPDLRRRIIAAERPEQVMDVLYELEVSAERG
jgi:mannitol/fructose-specific phosphotransferase system IIA component (Ntr-type)